jgi:hypothetical protein
MFFMNIICICSEYRDCPERRVLLLGEQLLDKLPHLALRVSTSGIAHLGDDLVEIGLGLLASSELTAPILRRSAGVCNLLTLQPSLFVYS